MLQFKKLSVYCGASLGTDYQYAQAAEELASLLTDAGIGLVYGGGKVGLMGVLADTMLSKGGEVIGVMPAFLVEKEIAHTGINKLHVVNSMQERKTLISELADGFILLPGGSGSLDEFFEIITWAQLGIHTKPCGILNVANYYDDLVKFLDNAVNKNFMKANLREMIIIENKAFNLLQRFAHYQAPKEFRWMKSTVTS